MVQSGPKHSRAEELSKLPEPLGQLRQPLTNRLLLPQLFQIRLLAWLLSGFLAWLLSGLLAWLLSGFLAWLLSGFLARLLSGFLAWLLSGFLAWLLSGFLAWFLTLLASAMAASAFFISPMALAKLF